MTIAWLTLIAAIVLEVGGTVCLKCSDGFSRILPTIGFAVFYGLSFWGLSMVLKRMEISMAYAVWAGLGTALVAVVGICFFGDRASLAKLLSITLIIVGVIGLNLAGNNH